MNLKNLMLALRLAALPAVYSLLANGRVALGYYILSVILLAVFGWLTYLGYKLSDYSFSPLCWAIVATLVSPVIANIFGQTLIVYGFNNVGETICTWRYTFTFIPHLVSGLGLLALISWESIPYRAGRT